MTLFFLLIVAHCLADYPLQNDFLAKAKNHKAPIPGIDWQIALVAHALIHAGFVYYLTHSIVLAMFELVAHTVIDYVKCDGVTSFKTDQLLHVLCKMLWVCLLTYNVIK